MRPKADGYGELNLPQSTKKEIVMTKIENRDARRTVVTPEVHGVSLEAGRESMVRKICGTIAFEPGVKNRGSHRW